GIVGRETSWTGGKLNRLRRLWLRLACALQHFSLKGYLMLSVIIPTLDCERLLVPTLASLVSGAAVGTVRDVIVADGGSRDATLEVADMAGLRNNTPPASPAGRLWGGKPQAPPP